MNSNNDEFERNLTSSLQFLFSKADAIQSEEAKSKRKTSRLTDLTHVFPYRLVGSDFVKMAMSSLEKVDHFGVLLIRPDELETRKGSTDKDRKKAILVDAALTINSLCKDSDALWGQLDDDLFSCFFTNKGVSASLEIARKIQSDLARARPETVCIGVAVYPTLTYKKEQILDNAYKALNHALLVGPDSVVSFDAVSLNISGDKYYQFGDVEGAIEEFKSALLLDASDINVHNSLGVCYGVLGEHETAQRYFETVIRLDDQEVMGWYNLGLITLMGDGDKNKALEYFTRAEKLEPDVFEINFQIGKLQTDRGNLEQGRIHLERAQKLNPNADRVYPYLGRCYLAEGMTDAAIKAYKKAIKHNPNDAASLSELGALYNRLSINPEIARVYCSQSVKIAPQNGRYRHRLGRVLFKAGVFEKALSQFRKANGLGFKCAKEIQKCEAAIVEAHSRRDSA